MNGHAFMFDSSLYINEASSQGSATYSSKSKIVFTNTSIIKNKCRIRFCRVLYYEQWSYISLNYNVFYSFVGVSYGILALIMVLGVLPCIRYCDRLTLQGKVKDASTVPVMLE